jgi:hypothetical protein
MKGIVLVSTVITILFDLTNSIVVSEPEPQKPPEEETCAEGWKRCGKF